MRRLEVRPGHAQPGAARPVTEPLSQRAYARRRGCAVNAVQKAIRDGRLHESIVLVDGDAKIADPELADREWDENTRQRPDYTAAEQPADAPATPQSEPRAAARPRQRGPDLPDGVPVYHVSQAVRAQAAARREAAAADLAELELAERRGQLVDATAARADVQQAYSLVKTRLLAVPTLVAQRLPQLAAEVVPVVESAIREALEELAG